MLVVVQESLDYTTCNVPDAFWRVENTSGTLSGNDTNQEYDPAHVFENPIFLKIFRGFENYTLGTLPLEEGGGAKHSPPDGAGVKIWQNHQKNTISENHQGSSWIIRNHSYCFLMIPRRHLNDPGLIL